MKAKIYVGAKKYALYIGRKIVEKTLEFLSLPARFVSKKVQDLKQYLMYGNSLQDGTPTPTTPVEVVSVGNRTKNLFDTSLSNDIAGGYAEYPLNLEIGKTYTLSLEKNICSSGANPYSKQYVFVLNKQGITSGWTQNTLAYFGNTNTETRGLKFTFTVPNEGASMYVYWAGIRVKPSDYLEILNTFFGNIQLEEGSTVTSFEPYGYKVPVTVGDTVTNIYLSEPLRKIGEYADYIDFENQKVVRNVREVKPKGFAKGIYGRDNHYRFLTTIPDKRLPVSVNERRLIFSNKYIADSTPIAYSETTSQYAITGYTGVTTVYIYDKDLDNAQSVVTDIDCVITYVLATPTEETITLPPINIPQGTLTIDTDTVLKPSKIEITGDIDNE